jgi:hypothetical protein
MRKIFGLLLLTGLLLGSNIMVARTDYSTVVKAGTAPETKKGIETTTKPGAPENKMSPSADDSAAMAGPDAPFYKPIKKRLINIQDIYVGLGIGYTERKGSINAPFYRGATLNATYGIPLINKYLILEITNNADFMFSPNKDWFSKAFLLKKSDIKGVGSGFYNEFATGLQAVIVGSRKVTFSAGPLAGIQLTMLPAVRADNSLYYVSAPVSFCYGLKTNLFIGKHFYCFVQYSNTIARNIAAVTSQASADFSVMPRSTPVDLGMLNAGVGYILQPWW